MTAIYLSLLVVILLAVAWVVVWLRRGRPLPPVPERERPPSLPPMREPERLAPREPCPPSIPPLPPLPERLEREPVEPPELELPEAAAEPALREVPVRTPRIPPPWYPIVLAHGVLGFDAIRMGFLHPAYFRGVAEQLRVVGNEVYVVRVSPVAGIAVRAAQLAHQIRQIPADRVNVVAHSMGGLDARYAITHLGLGERVASLTTIGTPHRGTPLADRGVWLVHERLGLHRLMSVLGVDAFAELTTQSLVEFNDEVPDARDVVYTSYPARVPGVRGVNSLLAAGYVMLQRVVGDNDGVVPTESQNWGEVLEEIEADHWAQVGWSMGFDAVGFYDQLVRALRRRRL